MRNLLIVALLGVMTSVGTADDPPSTRQPARVDLAKLQGTWHCVAMERDGGEIPADDLKGSTVVYEDDQSILYRDGKLFRRGIITLDPSKTPKRINTWDLGGPYQDQTVPGIYEIDGDTLKLCFSRPGDERPTEFSTKKPPGLIVATYKRTKP